MKKRVQSTRAERKHREGMPLIALVLTFVGATLGYFIAQVALYYQPHGYHLLGAPVGALVGWLAGQAIHTVQRRHSR